MDVSKLWGTLTQSQRTAWAGFAQTHKFVDVFGLAKKYSGQQMYMHCNLGLLSNNLALINDPPADLEVIPLGSIGAASSTSGVVQSVAVTAAGTGYTSQPTVGFSGGAGSGAAATSTLVPTTVASYTVGAGGTGYTTAPTVTVTGGGGTGATATATVVSGVVTAVTLVIAGSGYTTRPTVGFTGGGGTGATATAVLTATGVSSVIMTADGTGYTSAPTVAFTGGSGSGAAGTASITFATSGLALVFTPTPTTLPLEVWASFQMPVGRVYAKNLLRRIGTFGDGSTSPLDLSAAYTAVFGELPKRALSDRRRSELHQPGQRCPIGEAAWGPHSTCLTGVCSMASSPLALSSVVKFFDRFPVSSSIPGAGVVCAVDSAYFPGLQMLVMSLRSAVDVAVFDLGLDPIQLAWLSEWGVSVHGVWTKRDRAAHCFDVANVEQAAVSAVVAFSVSVVGGRGLSCVRRS